MALRELQPDLRDDELVTALTVLSRSAVVSANLSGFKTVIAGSWSKTRRQRT